MRASLRWQSALPSSATPECFQLTLLHGTRGAHGVSSVTTFVSTT